MPAFRSLGPKWADRLAPNQLMQRITACRNSSKSSPLRRASYFFCTIHFLIKVCLVKLNESSVYISQLHDYLVGHPAPTWILASRLFCLTTSPSVSMSRSLYPQHATSPPCSASCPTPLVNISWTGLLGIYNPSRLTPENYPLQLDYHPLPCTRSGKRRSMRLKLSPH